MAPVFANGKLLKKKAYYSSYQWVIYHYSIDIVKYIIHRVQKRSGRFKKSLVGVFSVYT